MNGSRKTTIQRLIGVYDADGSIRGELSYFIGARLGRAHCALCDITHGLVRPRAEWNAYRAQLAVPFVTYHRDDQPEAVRAASRDMAPVVGAETDGAVVILLERDALAACSSIDGLADAIEQAMVSAGLQWPARGIEH